MEFKDWIRENIKCCACESSMERSKYINAIALDKKVTWMNNTWGNIIAGISGYAIAIVCDDCFVSRTKPKYAVEWDDDETEVRYHPVNELKLMPEKEKRLLEILTGGQHLAG